MIPGVNVRATVVRTGTNPVKDCQAKNLLNNVYNSEDPRQNTANCPDVEETHCRSYQSFSLISDKHHRAPSKHQSFHRLYVGISSSPSPFAPQTAFPWIYFLLYKLPLCDHSQTLTTAPLLGTRWVQPLLAQHLAWEWGLPCPLQHRLPRHDQVSGVLFDKIEYKFFFQDTAVD